MPNDELGEDGSNMAAQMEHLHNVGVVPGQIDLEVLRGRYVVGTCGWGCPGTEALFGSGSSVGLGIRDFCGVFCFP